MKLLITGETEVENSENSQLIHIERNKKVCFGEDTGVAKWLEISQPSEQKSGQPEAWLQEAFWRSQGYSPYHSLTVQGPAGQDDFEAA